MKKRPIKPKAPSMLRKILNIHYLYVLGVIWIATIFAFTYFVNTTNEETGQQTSSKEYSVGQTAEIAKSYQISVTSIERSTDLEAKIRLPADQRILVANVKITNLSAEKMNFLPAIHTYLRDSQGESTVIFADIAQPALQAREIPPNESNEGKIAFIVNSQNIDRWLYFDTHFQNTAPTIYNVSKFE